MPHQNLPTLPPNATLPELQAYIKALNEARGWHNTPLELFLLFTEEMGELAKAIRNRIGLYQEAGKVRKPEELAHEFADVLGYLLDLANALDIDLEQSFRDKEAINAQRSWD